VSSNPVHAEVYSIQHYVIKFVSDLRQVGGFFRILQFPSPINWPRRYNWHIVESGVKHCKPINLFQNITMPISVITRILPCLLQWLQEHYHACRSDYKNIFMPVAVIPRTLSCLLHWFQKHYLFQPTTGQWFTEWNHCQYFYSIFICTCSH